MGSTSRTKLKTIPALAAVALVAALVIGPASAPAGHKKTTKIKVGNNFFAPTSKTIKRGTKVKFKWAGGVPHNVIKKKGPAGKFKSKTTSKSGVNYSKTFKKAGKYKLFCSIHPVTMKLTLKVK